MLVFLAFLLGLISRRGFPEFWNFPSRQVRQLRSQFGNAIRSQYT